MAAARSASSRRPAHGHEGGKRGVEGISGAGRAGDLRLQHRAIQDRLRGAHERPLAAIGHHHVAGTELAQAGEEIDHAHLVARRRRSRARRAAAAARPAWRQAPGRLRRSGSTSPGTSTSASERLTARMSICFRVSWKAPPREDSWRTPGLVATSAPCPLARSMMAGKASADSLLERRDVDHVGGKGLAAQIALLQQRIGAAEGEDGGVAVVRGDQHRGPGRGAAVAHGPARRHALLHQVAPAPSRRARPCRA